MTDNDAKVTLIKTIIMILLLTIQ